MAVTAAVVVVMSASCTGSDDASPTTTATPVEVDLAAGPQPAFWLTGTCQGACFPPLPDGLPQFTLYGDGRYVFADYANPLSISSGTAPSRELSELERLLGRVSLGRGATTTPIPLPEGFYVSEPTTTFFHLRLDDRTVTQGVDFPGGPNPESADRQAYADIVLWIGRLRSSPDRQESNPIERWVAIAPTEVPELGADGWQQLENGAWCSVFVDSTKEIPLSNIDTWLFPTGVTEFRPALPHEPDCAAVESWNTLRATS